MMKNQQIYRQIKAILDSAEEGLTLSLIEIAKHLRGKLPVLNGYSDQEIEEMIQISMNYEEQNADTFGLKDAIAWIKSNFDKARYAGGCIVRGDFMDQQETSDRTPNDKTYSQPDSPYPITIQLCFLDRQGEPLLEPSEKHKVVHCKTLEPDLERQFGNKNMIILR